MNIGETYKAIRENKNLTQKDVCQKEVTTVTLSKFENDKSTPSYSLMKFFLNQINMSFEEFEFLCTYDEFSKSHQIKMNFNEIILNTEKSKILKLLEEIDDYLNDNQNKTIQEIKNILIMSLEIENNGFSEKAIQFGINLWNSVVVKKEWYIDDLEILNFILFYFPADKVFDIVDRILERLDEYDGFGKDLIALKASILINLSTIYMINFKFERCEYIIDLAYNEAKKIKNYDFLAVCLIRQGILQQDKDKIFQGENLLEIVGEMELLKELRLETEKFYDKCEKI